jgi:hypothetical protein
MPLEPAHSSIYESENTIDFLWGYRYNGVVVAPKLDLTSYATELIKAVFGSDYSVSVYVEPELRYDFSFGLRSPYQAFLYLSDTSPRVKLSTSGHIFLEPRNIYFDFSSSSKIILKVGAEVFWKGLKIAGDKYSREVSLSLAKRFYTEHKSPLGTYRVSVKQLLEEAVGKILPKIELIFGAIAGAVIAIPLDWDFEFVFRSYVDATSRVGSGLSISPTTMTFVKSEALSFTIIPQAGGQDSVKWGFSQRMSMGIDFFIKAKFMADLALGIAASYETPWFSRKVLSSDLVAITQTSQNVLSSLLSIPLPKLTTTLASIDSGVVATTIKIFVNDETGVSISGARVDIGTKQNKYSTKDISKGYYTATIPTSELSSIQVSASKSGWERCSTEIALGTKYLEEYNSLNSKYTTLESNYGKLEIGYASLLSEHNSILMNYTALQSAHNELKTNMIEIQTRNNKLQSDYKELETRLSMYPAIQSLTYILAFTTALFVFSTVYLTLKRKQRELIQKTTIPHEQPLRNT